MVRKVAVLVMAVTALVVLAVPRGAVAADPPKWVAAIFMDVQRSIGLRWQPVAGAAGFKVLRSETQGADYKEIAAPTAPQYFDAAVEAGNTYYYVLQSVAAGGPSANSEERSVTVPGQKKKPVTAPVWRQLQDSQTTEFGKTSFKVALTWVKNPDVIAYNIYRSEVSGKGYQLIGSVSEDQYIDAAVQVDKTYYYVLSGLDNSFQESPRSAEKSVALAKQEAKKAEFVLPNPKVAVRGSKVAFEIRSGPNYQFTGSSDIAALSDGRFVEVEPQAKGGKIFEADGTFVLAFGEKGRGEGQFEFPLAVGVDADDNIYITDRGVTSKILVFNDKGVYKRTIQAPPPSAEYMEQMSKKDTKTLLSDVAIAKDGRIYATDNNLHRLVIMENSGKLIKDVGGPGTEEGRFSAPQKLAINEKGEVHVCNGFNRRIEVFDLDGNFIRNYGVSKSFTGSFIGATGITFDERGNSIVSDGAMSTIQFFDPEGVYLYHLGEADLAIDKASKQRSMLQVAGPGGVCFLPKTKVLVFGQGNEVKMIQGRTLLPEVPKK